MTNSFGDSEDWDRKQKWAIAVASFSLIVGAFSFFLRMFMTKMFTETKFEHAAAFIVLLFWSVGLPYINDYINDSLSSMFSLNLFFSSWIAFIMAMLLNVDMFPSMLLGEKVNTFTNHWVGLGTASLIVMRHAVTYWSDNECKSVDSSVCKRSLTAFILGTISGLFSLVFFAFQQELLEQAISILLFAAWCFGVAYFTFNSGPAMFIGAFYFSIWFAFMFSFWMAVHTVVALYNRMAGGDAGNEATTENKGGQEETAKPDVEEHEKEEVVVEEGNV
jgi:membrane protein implicated in regulation of membrane protease activity